MEPLAALRLEWSNKGGPVARERLLHRRDVAAALCDGQPGSVRRRRRGAAGRRYGELVQPGCAPMHSGGMARGRGGCREGVTMKGKRWRRRPEHENGRTDTQP